MSSIDGVLFDLCRRLNYTGRKVTPTQHDQRIAKRAEGIIKNLLTLEDFEDIEFSVSIADWRIEDQGPAGHSSGLSQAMAAADMEFSPEQTSRNHADDLSVDMKRKIVDAYDSAPDGSKLKAARQEVRGRRYWYQNLTPAHVRHFKLSSEATKTDRNFKAIKDYVKEQMLMARRPISPTPPKAIHETDLVSWGIVKAAQLGLTDFQASTSWARSIIDEMNWSSRKVNRLVTYRQLANEAVMAQERLAFAQMVRKDIADCGFNLHQVLNIDQSGVKYCIPSNRTLEEKGTRTVYCAVKDVQKTKSSFSVLQAITAAGTHVGPLCICFQETDGRFGVRVVKDIEDISSRHPGVSDQVFKERHVQSSPDGTIFRGIATSCRWPGTSPLGSMGRSQNTRHVLRSQVPRLEPTFYSCKSD